MNANPHFWYDKSVCVTGGTGFLGWHLVKLLLPLARRVRIFGLPPKSDYLRAQMRELDCIFADVRDPAAASQATRGCDIVFHTAGSVSVWGPALATMREIHLEGTRQILAALPDSARLIHTSSVVAVGATREGRTLTEDAQFDLQGLKVDYVHAKWDAERIALVAAERGRDVVVVNPAYLIGPDDHEGSVMGKFCLRCWRGKVPLIPPGGLNFVDVRDVAMGHLLAAERGARARRYILGGANLTMGEFIRAVTGVRGMSARWRVRMPRWFFSALAWCAELHAQFARREPYPSLQHARMNRLFWYYSFERARAELGYEPRVLNATIADMHDWYCWTGALKPMHGLTPFSEKNRRTAA